VLPCHCAQGSILAALPQHSSSMTEAVSSPLTFLSCSSAKCSLCDAIRSSGDGVSGVDAQSCVPHLHRQPVLQVQQAHLPEQIKRTKATTQLSMLAS